MTSEALPASFVRAVEQHHVLENSSEGVAEHTVVSSDLSKGSKHRGLVEQMIVRLDDKLKEVAVFDPAVGQLTDEIDGAGYDCSCDIYGGI